MVNVYWITRKGHQDIYSEGYVGITRNTLQERFQGHRKDKKDRPLVSAAKKYGWDNLSIDLVAIVEDWDTAKVIEEFYRPTQNIGWNQQKGGEDGVEPEWYLIEQNRKKHSLATSVATKKGIAEKDTTEARSQRAKDLWNSQEYRKNRKGISLGSNNPRAQLSEEQVYAIKYTHIPGGLTNLEIAEMYGVRRNVIRDIRSGKNWKHI